MDARYAEDFGAAPNRRPPPPEQLLVPDDDEDEEAMELMERGRDTPGGTTLIRASSMDRSVACDDRPISASYMPSKVGTRSVDVPAKQRVTMSTCAAESCRLEGQNEHDFP
jgi:hypothetical protein